MPRVLCVLCAVFLPVCADRQHLLMWPCPSRRMSLALKCLEMKVKACGVIFCCLCISCKDWMSGNTDKVQQHAGLLQRCMRLSLSAEGLFASSWPMEIRSRRLNMCVMVLLSSSGKIKPRRSDGMTYSGILEEILIKQSRQLTWKLSGTILRLMVSPLGWCGPFINLLHLSPSRWLTSLTSWWNLLESRLSMSRQRSSGYKVLDAPEIERGREPIGRDRLLPQHSSGLRLHPLYPRLTLHAYISTQA